MIDFKQWRGLPKNLKATCIASATCAIFAHLFILTNVLHNHDSMSELPKGYGSGLVSGRWLLALLGKIVDKLGGNYNLPFYNNVLSICLLIAASCFIVLIFDIQRPVFCALIGGMLIVAPPVTSMLFYAYTAPYYALAVLLSITTVWITDKYRWGFILGTLMCACALGIYQAYFPVTISLFVLLLIQSILRQDSEIKTIFRKGVLFLATLFLSLMCYFIILQVALRVQHKALADYQNIDKMGQMDIRELPALIKTIYSQFFSMIIQDYHGMSCTKILQFSILALNCISMILIILMLYWQKRTWRITLGCLALCGILPLAINSITLMAPHSSVYTLMIFASVTIYFLPIIVLDLTADELFPNVIHKIKRKFLQSMEIGAIFFLSIAIWSYVYQSNGNYTAMYYTAQQTNNYLNSLITQIKLTDGYHPSMEWALIGDNISDPLYGNTWGNFFNYGGNVKHLINAYARNNFIRNYTGLASLPLVNDETLAKLKEDSFIQAMPCFPENGSIQVYQGVVVIKLEAY